MYRCFELPLPAPLNGYQDVGRALSQTHRAEVRRKLDSFALNKGSLNGSDIQDIWFPNIETDVFISHSHSDEDVALSLAGWLSSILGLRPFVDSSIWGYAADLLKIIDNTYCKIPNTSTYDYDLRNESTSHVHMMLSSALNMMIDSAECTIFLNTPNSISTSEAVEKTKSPWIYSELGFIELARRRKKEAHRGMLKEATHFSIKASRHLEITYTAKRTSLTRITPATLRQWQAKFEAMERFHVRQNALDYLYDIA